MKDLLTLVLRSETVVGLIPFLGLVFSDLAIFGFLQSIFNGGDRELFNCVPRWNGSTEQRCYDNYTLDLGLKFYLIFVIDGGLFFLWIFTMVQNTRNLWKIKHNRMIWNEDQVAGIALSEFTTQCKFKKRQLLKMGGFHLCTGIATIDFCFFYNFIQPLQFSSPHVYNCSLYSADRTPVLVNQTFSCFDQHYKEKADFNTATVAIKSFVMVLNLINFIYIVKIQPNELVDMLLGDFVEEDGRVSQQGDDYRFVHLTFIYSKFLKYKAAFLGHDVK